MDNLTIEGSAKTPTVEFEGVGKLLIKGRSIPENSIEFYKNNLSVKPQCKILRKGLLDCWMFFGKTSESDVFRSTGDSSQLESSKGFPSPASQPAQPPDSMNR